MKFADGFYAVVVSIILITIFGNLVFLKWGDDIHIYQNVTEIKGVISPSSFDLMLSSIQKMKSFLNVHLSVLSDYILSDYVISIYMKFYLVLNMIPLFGCFVLMGFSEGRLSRSIKIVSFGTYSVFRFQVAKKIMILTSFVSVTFYITYPYHNVDFNYLILGVFLIVSICVRILCANLPQRI